MPPGQKLPTPVLPCLHRHLPTSLAQLGTPRPGRQQQAAPRDRSAIAGLTHDPNCSHSFLKFYLPELFFQLFLPAFFFSCPRDWISSSVVNILLSELLWCGGREQEKKNAVGDTSFHSPCGVNISISTERRFVPRAGTLEKKLN